MKKGLGFAGGVKGFPAGFGKHVLAPWGEPIMKQFVHEAVEEASQTGIGIGQATHASRGWR